MSDQKVIDLDASAVSLLRRALYAASRNSNRAALRCAHFDGDAVVCTDSYRLTVAYFDGEEVSDLTVEAAGLKAALPKRLGATIIDPSTLLQSHQKYPNWRSLIDHCVPTCEVEVRVDAARSFLKPVPKLVYIDTDKGTLAAELYTAVDMKIAVTGPPVGVVAFNGTYFMDLLKNSAGGTVTFDLADRLAPAKVREPGLTHLLMPVRVS